MRQLQLDFMMNSMNTRWIRILNHIEKEPSFTLVALSEILTVSQRTLVKDVYGIKQYFGSTINLQSKQNGFQFEEVHHFNYMEKKATLLESEILFDMIGQIFKGKLKSVQDLAHEYNYGETTFRRFLLRAEKAIDEYGLSFSLNPVDLIGEEECIRKFFYDFYSGGDYTPYTIRPTNTLQTVIRNQLLGRGNNYEIGTGASASGFYFLVYLMMNRFQEGKKVTVCPLIVEQVEKEQDFDVLYSLKDAIADEFEVSIPKEEFIWLYLVLVTQRSMNRLEQERLFYMRFNQWPSTTAIAEKVFSDSQFEEWDQSLLKEFMASFLVSKSLAHAIHPVWNKQQAEEKEMALKRYPKTYYKNYKFLYQHQQLLGLGNLYFEDVVVAFTLFTNLLLESYRPKKSILFLLEGDAMVVQSIRHQAKTRFGSQHRLLFLQLQELTSDRIANEEIDLIVTNYRPYLWDFPFEKDYFLVNTIPNEADWSRVKQELNHS